jgi:hypothetical protein
MLVKIPENKKIHRNEVLRYTVYIKKANKEDIIVYRSRPESRLKITDFFPNDIAGCIKPFIPTCVSGIIALSTIQEIGSNTHVYQSKTDFADVLSM